MSSHTNLHSAFHCFDMQMRLKKATALRGGAKRVCVCVWRATGGGTRPSSAYSQKGLPLHGHQPNPSPTPHKHVPAALGPHTQQANTGVPGDEPPMIIQKREPINQQHRNQQCRDRKKKPTTYPEFLGPAYCDLWAQTHYSSGDMYQNSTTALHSLPLGLLPSYVHPLPPNPPSLFLSQPFFFLFFGSQTFPPHTTASFKGVCLFLKAESVTVPSSHVHFALGLR
ncbi:unnamed protein product [Leuciscus chuanchicus]